MVERFSDPFIRRKVGLGRESRGLGGRSGPCLSFCNRCCRALGYGFHCHFGRRRNSSLRLGCSGLGLGGSGCHGLGSGWFWRDRSRPRLRSGSNGLRSWSWRGRLRFVGDSEFCQGLREGFACDRLRKEWRSGETLHIGRDVVRRGEYHLQIRQVGEECIAEGKSIQRGEINFRDE